MMTGYAEVTFERRQHLDLAGQHHALDLPTWVNRKPVLPVYALPDLAAHDLALADLRARPARGLGFAGAQDELGGGSRGQSRRLVVAVDGAKLGDGLKAKHRAESAFAPAHDQRFEFRLTPQDRQLVGDDPHLAARLLGGHQAAHDAVEPHALQRKRRLARFLGGAQKQPAVPRVGPFECAPGLLGPARKMTERAGSVEGRGDDPGALLVRAWIYEGLGRSPLERLLQLVRAAGRAVFGMSAGSRDLSAASRPTIRVRADWRKKKSAPPWLKVLGGSGTSAAASASASIASLPGISSHHGDHDGQRVSSGFSIRSPRSGR